MQIMPIDLTSVIATTLGILIVLIPVAGLTARFALKPIAEAMARVRESQGSKEQFEVMRQRLDLMEQQMQNLESDVHRLTEVAEFQAQLNAPKS